MDTAFERAGVQRRLTLTLTLSPSPYPNPNLWEAMFTAVCGALVFRVSRDMSGGLKVARALAPPEPLSPKPTP